LILLYLRLSTSKTGHFGIVGLNDVTVYIWS
jgi:hypothetical protein